VRGWQRPADDHVSATRLVDPDVGRDNERMGSKEISRDWEEGLVLLPSDDEHTPTRVPVTAG
jgi:hypothetical protein